MVGLAALGIWIAQGLLPFALAIHLAAHHRSGSSSEPVDLASVLHGHDHTEETPEHSHDPLPAEPPGETSRLGFWLGLLSFAPRNGLAAFPHAVLIMPTGPQLGMGQSCTIGPIVHLGPPLLDKLNILLI